jgi:hypothetical protein
LIVRELISEERRELFHVKNNYNMKRIADTDSIKVILKHFKIYDEDAEKKLTFKPHQINCYERAQIIPWESEHTNLLQRSGYLVIENDIEELKKRDASRMKLNEIKINYAKKDMVEHKRQLGLIFKGSFLFKMINMRNNGMRLTGLARIQKLISDNIEDYIDPADKHDY